MTIIWWILWTVSDQPDINTSHWLSWLILLIGIDIYGASVSNK